MQGDISENAEYDAAKDAQAHNVARSSEVEDKLAKVRIIEDENIPGDKIYIGAIVTLKDLDSDEKLQYMMVSPEESDYEENKLSIFAPIGKALMGKAQGEELEIKMVWSRGNLQWPQAAGFGLTSNCRRRRRIVGTLRLFMGSRRSRMTRRYLAPKD